MPRRVVCSWQHIPAPRRVCTKCSSFRDLKFQYWALGDGSSQTGRSQNVAQDLQHQQLVRKTIGGPTPALPNQSLHFNLVPRRFMCTLEFEKHLLATYDFLTSQNALKAVTSYAIFINSKRKRGGKLSTKR